MLGQSLRSFNDVIPGRVCSGHRDLIAPVVISGLTVDPTTPIVIPGLTRDPRFCFLFSSSPYRRWKNLEKHLDSRLRGNDGRAMPGLEDGMTGLCGITGGGSRDFRHMWFNTVLSVHIHCIVWLKDVAVVYRAAHNDRPSE
jgi:hypothetical protein